MFVKAHISSNPVRGVLFLHRILQRGAYKVCQ